MARTLVAAIFALGSVACLVEAQAGVTCVGDCDGDGAVTVAELVAGVHWALEGSSDGSCTAMDADGSGAIEIAELVRAVGHALDGCPHAAGALFRIRACGTVDPDDGEVFRVLIRDPAIIAQADALVGAGNVQIVNGPLRAGDGGFNAPWSWHLDPDAVGFADITIELCDGCPSFVENDLGYWLDTVGQYCPWSTEVLARER